MRTNIEIDDKLMKQAMKATGAPTKKAAVEAALRQTVDLHGQRRLRDLSDGQYGVGTTTTGSLPMPRSWPSAETRKLRQRRAMGDAPNAPLNRLW